MTPEELTRLTTGLTVERVEMAPAGGFTVYFTNGAFVIVHSQGNGLVATFRQSKRRSTSETANGPTSRQREYLAFIARYTSRYGASPAETDIARHFMVSAPSVNQMIRTLENRGFIERGRDRWGQAMPQSIRVLVDLPEPSEGSKRPGL